MRNREDEKKRHRSCKLDGGSIKTQESRLHAVVDADVGEEEYRRKNEVKDASQAVPAGHLNTLP